MCISNSSASWDRRNLYLVIATKKGIYINHGSIKRFIK